MQLPMVVLVILGIHIKQLLSSHSRPALRASFTAGKIKGGNDVDITLGVSISLILEIPDLLTES